MIFDKVVLLSLLAAASGTDPSLGPTTSDSSSSGSSSSASDNSETLAAGETKCTCALPGGSKKCTTRSDQTLWEKCSWLQECHTSSNISFSMCISKGNKVCNRHVHLGTSGSIVAVKEHKPYMICCEEEACTSRQECIEQEGGAGTFEYDRQSWTLDHIAHNGWKTKEGTSFKNKPRVCIDRVFDATQAAKSILAPFFAMVFAILFILLGCCNRNVSRLSMVLPTIIIVTSFFLSLSEGVVFAMFTMGVAAATIATPSQHKGKLVLFQVVYAWLVFGGTNWFFGIGATTSSGTKTRAITVFSALIQADDLIGLETSCKKYYDQYYALNINQKTYKTDSTFTTWGLCERDWLQFLTLVACFQAFAFFLMVALTTLEYLSPTKAGKGMKMFKREKTGVSPTPVKNQMYP